MSESVSFHITAEMVPLSHLDDSGSGQAPAPESPEVSHKKGLVGVVWSTLMAHRHEHTCTQMHACLCMMYMYLHACVVI